MSARSCLIGLAFLASSAHAAPTIDPQYGSHSVIQRGRPITLTGTAAPREPLKVRFGEVSANIIADEGGTWRAKFNPHDAGGPYRIEVRAGDGTAIAEDVMVGDVWLCSGQSNMEYPLRRALNGDGEVQGSADPGLRLMKIPQQLALEPRHSFAKVPAWRPATPASAADFSAACYFMVRDFRASEKVPVGAIDDSWGGTPIRAWMNEDAVRVGGNGEAAESVDEYRRDPDAAERGFGEIWGSWWRSKTGDLKGVEPWNASDRLAWKPVPSLGYWDNWGPEWKSWIGSAWARLRITLTAAEAGEAATLSLSAVDDMDQTFVNGVSVGGRNDPANPRHYPVTKGILKPGTNEILVFVRNLWGQGGFAGPADAFALEFADGHRRPLLDGWEYSRIKDEAGTPPTAPWEGSSGVANIYNAMIAPLGHLGLRGVAWYQGEADVGERGYDKRLGALAANWRTQFEDPDLPFLIVGLAGWGKPVSHPVESGWASLINEQRLAVVGDRNSALISAIDLGEPNDIHPANKQEVGRRLALAAHQLAYRDKGSIAALPSRAVRSGATIEIAFTKPLEALGGKSVNGFELCGPAGGSCRYADAQVKGARVVIAADGLPVTRVRYAWADYPIVNLYDLDMLPVPVFELPL